MKVDFAAQIALIRNAFIDGLKDAFFKAIRPQEDLSLDKWADKYRVLPKASSSEPGPWRTDRFPYLREIMLELSPTSNAKEVVLMGGSQIGKTEVAINLILYAIDHRPGPIMYIQPTIDTVKKFSRQRIDPSVAICEPLKHKVTEQKSRNKTNTALVKSFPGGIFIMAGTNSAPSLRSTPIEILIADEIDAFELDVGGEGDPTKLAEKRTTNFPRRKVFKLSTPGTKEVSKIEPLFEGGDRRYYMVPCPHCSKKQRIVWPRIKYEGRSVKTAPKTAKLECEACHVLIEERFKTWMLENGEWIGTNSDGAYPSFHINALYSPLGFYSWGDAVKDHLESMEDLRRGDKQKRIVFTNTVLAETWVESGKTISHDIFKNRLDIYPADVPSKALILTAGVDVQDDRIEVEVLGWGKGQESWGVEYARIMGDTENDDTWQQLDDFLNKYWIHESGRQMNIACALIDSGHRARRVYQYCKSREFRRFYAAKGRGGWGNGLITRPTKKNKDNVWLFITWPDELKSKIYSQILVERPGPGYCHFPEDEDGKKGFDENYFQMLTSERLLTRRVSGHMVPTWDLPSGRRNEALDCRGLNIGALNVINPNFDAIALRGPIVVATTSATKRKAGNLSKGISV